MFASPQLDLVRPIAAKELISLLFLWPNCKPSTANSFSFNLFRTLCTNQTHRKRRISPVFNLLRTLAKTIGDGMVGMHHSFSLYCSLLKEQKPTHLFSVPCALFAENTRGIEVRQIFFALSTFSYMMRPRNARPAPALTPSKGGDLSWLTPSSLPRTTV